MLTWPMEETLPSLSPSPKQEESEDEEITIVDITPPWSTADIMILHAHACSREDEVLVFLQLFTDWTNEVEGVLSALGERLVGMDVDVGEGGLVGLVRLISGKLGRPGRVGGEGGVGDRDGGVGAWTEEVLGEWEERGEGMRGIFEGVMEVLGECEGRGGGDGDDLDFGLEGLTLSDQPSVLVNLRHVVRAMLEPEKVVGDVEGFAHVMEVLNAVFEGEEMGGVEAEGLVDEEMMVEEMEEMSLD